MKIKDITETGFYIMLAYKDTEDEIIYEALENTDKEWLKDNPDEKIVIDEWYFDHEENGKKVYQTSGGIYALGLDLAEIEVEKVDGRYEIYGPSGAFLKELPTTLKKVATLKILVECRYDFYNNRINKGKVYTVTEEDSKYYFCKDIGRTFKKEKENIADLNIGNCWCELVIWKTREVSEDKLEFNVSSMKNDLRIKLKETLQERIDNIEYN